MTRVTHAAEMFGMQHRGTFFRYLRTGPSQSRLGLSAQRVCPAGASAIMSSTRCFRWRVLA
jgi:hypothetical protein